MNKRLNTILLCIITVGYINAQHKETSYVISYETVNNIEKDLMQIPDEKMREQYRKMLAAPQFYTLTISGNEASYQKEKKESVKDDDGITTSSDVQIIVIGDDNPVTHTYLSEKNYIQSMNLLGKQFLISDNLPERDWQLVSETKKIGNLNCFKATTTNEDGLPVEAWYALELPFPSGPETYGGLPGVIVELKTPKKYYIATSFRQVPFEKLTVPSKGTKVTAEKFQQILAETVENAKSGRLE
ncbi:MAG: GLPGLI family protein [Capnocytophaga sp.]|nr:GLPGLI family protein [Capnocytophaga sp.]